MDRRPCAIEGELVAIKLAGRMEETLQAFAVRAACFIGELDRSFSEEFDGQDFSAVHLLAYLGEEPIGTVRIRWFESFAMPDRLAVMQRFRGHEVGRFLLERACALADSRGSKMLYMRVTPEQSGYFEKQGWLRLDEKPGLGGSLALVWPIGTADGEGDLDTTDAAELSARYERAGAASAPPALA